MLWSVGLILLISQVVCVPISNTDKDMETDDKKEVAEKVNNLQSTGSDETLIIKENNPFGDFEDDEDDYDDEADICIVCRDDFVEDEALDLACGHKYHLDCLRKFQRSTGNLNKCFVCMKDLVIKNDEGLDLLDFFYKQEFNEIVQLKLKMGLMASRFGLPYHWQNLPEKWVGSYL